MNEPYEASIDVRPTVIPHCWFLAELFTRKSLKVLYTLWLLVLVFCIVLTVLAAAQFDCYDFCGQASQSCSIFGVTAPASCVNLTTTNWTSTGNAIGTSTLRRFSRIVIAQPGSISVPSLLGIQIPNSNTSVLFTTNSTISLIDSSLNGADFLEIDANGQMVKQWTLDKQVSNGFISLLLPEGFSFSSRTRAMTVRLRQQALFRNGTLAGPYSTFSDHFYSSDLSMIFLSLSPTYAVIEVIVRYVAIVINLAFCLTFIVSRSSLDSDVSIAALKAFDVKAFAADHGVIVAFHIIVVIFCDPLVGFTLGYPTDGFLRYWSDHFTYALFISVVMLLGMYLSVTMPFVFHADRWWYRLTLSLVSAAFALAYFILDALVASRGKSTGLVFSNPQSGDSFLDAVAIAGIVVVSLWCTVVAVFFIANNHRIVWNHGKRLYSGRVRLRIVALRLVASCLAMYALYWICIYIPVQVTYSTYVPIFGRSGIQDTVAATWIACLVTGLFIARRYLPSDAPLRPQRFDKVTDSHRPLWQLQPWNSTHFRFLEAFTGYFFLTEKDKMQFQRKNHRVAQFRSFFCWETANACLSLSNEVYYDAPESSCFASIAAEPTELESCIACCCCCCMGPTSADEKQDFDTHDEPENVCESRVLNVEQHGYTLVSSLNIAGVQVIVTFMVGDDRGDPRYRWGDEAQGESPADTGSAAGASRNTTPISRSNSLNFASVGRRTHIVVTFRGTANSANAFTDATVTRTVFRAMADRTSGRAQVHSGFSRCWDSLQPQVFGQIEVARNVLGNITGRHRSRGVPVIFTGHSLGGALAVLGAYAYCRLQNKPSGDSVQVYTFGMPRVGNVPFVNEYNLLCPETYRVTNENDKVSEVGHCFRAHVGRTVVVDRDGNFLVEPNAIEERYKVLSGGGFAVKNHFLYRYGRAFDRVFAELGAPFKSFLASEPVVGNASTS